jgi:hypothetical protein
MLGANCLHYVNNPVSNYTKDKMPIARNPISRSGEELSPIADDLPVCELPLVPGDGSGAESGCVDDPEALPAAVAPSGWKSRRTTSVS